MSAVEKLSIALTTEQAALVRQVVESGEYADEKFATTHFFNPVLYTQMIEVVRGGMDDAHYAPLLAFLTDLGRKPVETKDISGFVSNSVLMVYAVMALRLIESGATIEAVDSARENSARCRRCSVSTAGSRPSSRT